MVYPANILILAQIDLKWESPIIVEGIPSSQETASSAGDVRNSDDIRNSGDTIPIQENWVASPNSGNRVTEFRMRRRIDTPFAGGYDSHA
jgi:hypothetical protein